MCRSNRGDTGEEIGIEKRFSVSQHTVPCNFCGSAVKFLFPSPVHHSRLSRAGAQQQAAAVVLGRPKDAAAARVLPGQLVRSWSHHDLVRLPAVQHIFLLPRVALGRNWWVRTYWLSLFGMLKHTYDVWLCQYCKQWRKKIMTLKWKWCILNTDVFLKGVK
jgi:hypothetical protein